MEGINVNDFWDFQKERSKKLDNLTILQNELADIENTENEANIENRRAYVETYGKYYDGKGCTYDNIPQYKHLKFSEESQNIKKQLRDKIKNIKSELNIQ